MITRNNLKEITFSEIDKLYYESISIGRTWKTRRSISLAVRHDGETVIKVTGQPRQGEYRIYDEFNFSEEGFEAAKKFALT